MVMRKLNEISELFRLFLFASVPSFNINNDNAIKHYHALYNLDTVMINNSEMK